MKVKNLVFFGVAAAILSTAGANAYTKVPVPEGNDLAEAKGTVTSKYYVDTAANSLKDDIESVAGLSDIAVTHTANTAAGSATQPVYIAQDGTATATTYQLNKTVPADAVFTDTTYTEFSTQAAGLVPVADNDSSKVLTAGGTWVAHTSADNAVTHTANTAAGSATQPVYIAQDGTATATTYQLNKTVPADAVFTDTTYTGSTTIDITNDVVSANTGAVADGAGTLTTGDQVYDFVNGRIPARPATGDCSASDTVPCALVADGNSLVWRHMAI